MLRFRALNISLCLSRQLDGILAVLALSFFRVELLRSPSGCLKLEMYSKSIEIETAKNIQRSVSFKLVEIQFPFGACGTSLGLQPVDFNNTYRKHSNIQRTV